MATKKPLEIDMCAASQLRDTQGEMLSVEGADISDLQNGKGRLNDNHGAGFFNAIGRVTSAKKIFKEEDCENDRHKYYWDKIKAPYIYVRGLLYDDSEHPNARAAAAILRHIHQADVPLKVKASVEGGVIQRGIADSSLLARTKIHSVAITMTPANNATLVEPLSLDKSLLNQAADMELIKSVMHLAQTNVPSFRHIVRDASATKVQKNMHKIASMMKEMGIDKELHIPSKERIIKQALEQKILNNIHKINETVKSATEELDKGLKTKLAGAALGAATLLAPQGDTRSPQLAPTPHQEAAAKKMSHKEVFNNVAKQYPLLGALGYKESGGAENFAHQTVTDKKSPHYGHTAGGAWGIMPQTAVLMMKTDPALAKKYPQLVEAAKDIGKNHQVFTQTLNNDPQADADFAVSNFKRNQSKTKSPEQLAYSWLNGLKGSWNKYKAEGQAGISSHPYVKEVMAHYEKLKPKKSKQNKPLKKALTAGYGGAGAPTNMTGGAVIQSESIDDGRPKFKYITCDRCGNEQVHAKHQVKCRQCGQSFSLEKLYSLLSKR